MLFPPVPVSQSDRTVSQSDRIIAPVPLVSVEIVVLDNHAVVVGALTDPPIVMIDDALRYFILLMYDTYDSFSSSLNKDDEENKEWCTAEACSRGMIDDTDGMPSVPRARRASDHYFLQLIFSSTWYLVLVPYLVLV